MVIEINLVGNQNQVYTNLFEFRARKRAQVADDAEAMGAIAAFLAENIAIIDAAIADKGLVSRLQGLQTLSINDYYSLKFLLAQSGLDILTFIVAEQEVNSDNLDRGILEYNVIDTNYPDNSFLHRATKITAESDSSHMSEVYAKIQEIYNFFESDLFEGYKNPMANQIDLIKETETLIGKAPEGSTLFVNSVLEYMGKQIILIVNKNEI